MPTTDSAGTRQRIWGNNSDFEWNEFDSVSYVNKNYSKMYQADQRFVKAMRDFFVAHVPRPERLRGLDVGTGTNLYPALSMLPFCRDITLLEYSKSNVDWLAQEIGASEETVQNQPFRGYSSNWDPYWNIFTGKEPYADLTDPRRRLAELTHIENGSVFDLPNLHGKWGIGTMFFVAESISSEIDQFHQALSAFVGALDPGAPLATAFMENSEGYRVGDLGFPAVGITGREVEECLRDHCRDLTFVRQDAEPGLRPGYTGMVLACGITRDKR